MHEIGNPEGISLYFHIPFCTKKCPYCHFYVLPDNEDSKKLLLQGLEKEWQHYLPQIQGKKILSVYFGGGTPSLFGPSAINTILNWIQPTSDCEITLETNPETSIQDYQGINRVSIGVQSLDDSSLSILGRNHNAKKAIEAIESCNIPNISCDLMYDLPHQNLSSWERTLHKLTQLPITHVSLYNLTFEPNTVFFKRKKTLTPHLPSPETSLQMLQTAVSSLENSGFSRYEISAFAKPNFHSIHNIGYWIGRPFIGFGPSAFSYWNNKRFRNCANLKLYVEKLQRNESPVDFEEELPYPANLNELLAIRLRLLEGADISHTPPETRKRLTSLKEKGWVTINDNQALLTPDGLLFYDSVAETLI